jgi:hypothetical protein
MSVITDEETEKIIIFGGISNKLEELENGDYGSM